MTTINRNREPCDPGRKLRLEDQVQRLQTYNDLLRDTLQELYDLRLGRGTPEAYAATLKKCAKVLAVKAAEELA